METLTSLAPAGAAVIAAVVASLITAAFLRRTGKEQNDTSAFTAITDKLFRLVEEAEERIANLEGEVKELKLERAENRRLITESEDRVDNLEGEVKSLRGVNGRLSRYVGKLVRNWPQGEHLPEPDEPVTWDIPEV